MDTSKLIHLIRTIKSVKHAKLIHQKVITSGLQNNIAICKNLINLLFSCQLFQSARIVFQSIQTPSDITLWNSLISNYTKNSMFNEALEIFNKLMHFTLLKPDSYTYPSVLSACSRLGFGNFGKMIHTQLVKNGLESDVVVMSSLLGMYAKCGMFRFALKVFDEMPERDVACWNTVISCYSQDGQYAKTLDLFQKMKDHGFEHDSVSFTTAISACAKIGNLEKGKEIHDEAVRHGFVSDGFVLAALVDMYGKCGCLDLAVQIFEQIPFKSMVSWNSMIAGYSLRGDSKSCIQLLSRMNLTRTKPNSTSLSSSLKACSKSANLKHGQFIHGYIIRNNIKADTFIYTNLVDVYLKCGNISSAEYIFKTKMVKTNVVEWNLMISGYVAIGLYLEALGVYNDMDASCVKSDDITFTSVLSACSQLGALERGKEIHKSIIDGKFESNEIVIGALLDMYTKCGEVDEAQRVFNRLPKRDLISWTTMITAYGAHGQALKALKMFEDMKKLNLQLDRVVFLAVISTCSHAGLVNEGCYYFNQMVNEYGIKPKIADYSCLVDLLGRAGRLRDAYAILQRNLVIKEDVELLSTLFSACHLHGDLELGQEIAGLLIDKDHVDPSTYIVLANMYASIKKWDEARKVRMKMKELGLRKNPGCAWIEIDKKIEPFLVEDKLIPKSGMVYDCLSILAAHMNKDELLFQNTVLNM
ncbi:pentatricopeptide repeat-containing protein At5g27110 [Rutidosis leptorrhynchoides]|uniref:pentatricopeptide repeat-containing protein At5g27110 n=1 Tax=Rutidosis leptorrhynchoides TaxID=125765 RepID=UPI003A99ADB1